VKKKQYGDKGYQADADDPQEKPSLETEAASLAFMIPYAVLSKSKREISVQCV
jgi:hypothetical protein